MNVKWRDRQSSVGRESDYLIQTEMFSDLCDFVNKYRLKRASLEFLEEKYSNVIFRLIIGENRYKENLLDIMIARIDEYPNESTGEVDVVQLKRKDLVFGSLADVEWVFEEGQPFKMQKKLINSNLCNDLQNILSQHSIKKGSVYLDYIVDPEQQYFKISLQDQSEKWLVKSSYFNNRMVRHKPQYVVGRIKKLNTI